jgi:hypothetical protein
MAINPKQNALYFREWAKAKAVYVKFCGYTSKEAEAMRHDLHLDALGSDKSHLDFTNDDLDAVLDAFEAVSVLESGPHGHRSRAAEMPRRRAIYAVEKYGLPDPYVMAISVDQFGTPDWRDLPFESLRLLRITCRKRAQAKAKNKTP